MVSTNAELQCCMVLELKLICVRIKFTSHLAYNCYNLFLDICLYLFMASHGKSHTSADNLICNAQSMMEFDKI